MAVDHTRVSLRTGGGTEPLTTGSSFRQRCASALTHPATIAALAALLLNDLVFKTMWPGSWTTGKLSDLAWVVFASPLLAFLLSFPAGRSRAGQRAAFLVAYAGLPLLYAAFNTFEPVHDFILQGLSTASGGNTGSPLDVTDSLVIPLGLGVALWVWRSGVPSAETLRLRGALLIAGVAALASVATSNPGQTYGVIGVSPDAGGTITTDTSGYEYQSTDGGLTWQELSRAWEPEERMEPGMGNKRVDTPRGTHAVQGPDVFVLGSDGNWERVYSTRYMGTEANVWVQEHATGRFALRVITTEPRSINYDPASGNVIVSMGIQGVIVGAPDGTWNRYAVGPYSPMDYSFLGKTGLLLSRTHVWGMALAVALSMLGAALLALQYRRSYLWLLGLGVFVSLLLPALRMDPAFFIFEYEGVVFLLIALVVGAVTICMVAGNTGVWKIIESGLVLVSLLASCYLLLWFGDHESRLHGAYDLWLTAIAIPAYALGVTVLAISHRELRRWTVVAPTFLLMNGLVFLPLMLWLHLGISLTLAWVSALILPALAGLLLAGHIRRSTALVGIEPAP